MFSYAWLGSYEMHIWLALLPAICGAKGRRAPAHQRSGTAQEQEVDKGRMEGRWLVCGLHPTLTQPTAMPLALTLLLHTQPSPAHLEPLESQKPSSSSSPQHHFPI